MSFYFEYPAGLISLVTLAFVLIILRRRGSRFAYLACFSIFWIYLSFVIKITLFPIEIVPERAAIIGPYFSSYINLIPFYFGQFASFEGTLPGVLLNILLTVPFGFGLNFLTTIKPGHVIWLSISTGLLIEGTQLIISLCLGYPYRVIDINDVICNAAGVLIGYGIFLIFAMVFLRVGERFGMKHSGLFEYIFEIAQIANKA